MSKFKFLWMFTTLLLMGCGSTTQQYEPVDYNAKFETLLNKFQSDPKSVPYEELWFAYLDFRPSR